MIGACPSAADALNTLFLEIFAMLTRGEIPRGVGAVDFRVKALGSARSTQAPDAFSPSSYGLASYQRLEGTFIAKGTINWSSGNVGQTGKISD